MEIKINYMQNKNARDLMLLYQSPKDFLYSFTYSKTEKVFLKKYEPEMGMAASSLVEELKTLSSDVKFYLIGSVGLKIDGKGDIDLFATTKTDLNLVADKYKDLIGDFSKNRKEIIEWNFIYRKYNVDLYLTKPDNKHFRDQIRLFELLKNKKYLNEYADLKKQLEGSSVREYVRQRMAFFNRILRETKNR